MKFPRLTDYLKFLPLLFCLTGCATITPTIPHINCPSPKVPIYGFAQAFLGDAPITNAKIIVLETGKIFKTDQQGKFAFCEIPGKPLTLLLTKNSVFPWDNYQSTQTATVIVPKEGLQNKFQEITFQVPRKITYNSLQEILALEHGIKQQPNTCTVATTITAFNKTLFDDPQGEPGARILLWHSKQLIQNPPVIYFGIIFGKTNPFNTTLTSSSADGGALLYNLPPSDKLYYLSASKPGKHFSKVAFWCRPGAFLNLSPPYGPRVQ